MVWIFSRKQSDISFVSFECVSFIIRDMGRKKNSNVKKKSINDSFDEEEAIRIYSRRKSFERTENIGLETT